jgi:hypothetical protein
MNKIHRAPSSLLSLSSSSLLPLATWIASGTRTTPSSGGGTGTTSSAVYGTVGMTSSEPTIRMTSSAPTNADALHVRQAQCARECMHRGVTMVYKMMNSGKNYKFC